MNLVKPISGAKHDLLLGEPAPEVRGGFVQHLSQDLSSIAKCDQNNMCDNYEFGKT